MSNVGKFGGRSVNCREVWRSECQVLGSVVVGVSNVGECEGWSVKCRGVGSVEVEVSTV